MSRVRLVIAIGLGIGWTGLGGAVGSAQDTEVGATRIALWKDDKKAALMLMFDDSVPSHVRNVIPALQEKGITGIFYNNPGTGQWKANQAYWETKAPALSCVVYANHTMTHKGFSSMDHAEQEILQSNEVIYRLFPGKQPRLISYADPGGVKHEIAVEQIEGLLAKHQLVRRPPFHGHGAGVHFKTADDILKAVDASIETGGMEHVIFHGVGGDWISFDLQQFHTLLTGLETRKGDLWITDHISVHQYQTETEGARVVVSKANESQIELELKSPADPNLYDLPLTLITHVPAAWTECLVTQKGRKLNAVTTSGEVRYEAIPAGGPITILAATK